MKHAETPSTTRCANEGCPRLAEPGERYCAACGLERALFRREARRAQPEDRTSRGREADRR
jgi:uncharacterized Zn finger protein (UPF0148 family)